METFEFRHDAMNTELILKLRSDNYNYASSAAHEAFELADSLENLLSIYRDGSDIACVNALKVGEIFTLTSEASDCLMASFQAAEMSGGAIDVCSGEFFLAAKGDKTFPLHTPPARGAFEFDPQHLLIRKSAAGRIDLGAIGKGFTVDSIAKMLRKIWEIENIFINFGASSVASFGDENDASSGWSVNLGNIDGGKIALKNSSVGASGTAILGDHIVDARSGEISKFPKFRTWAFDDSAAISDAMSTAFMILSPDEIRRVCKDYNLRGAFQVSENSPVEKVGF